MKKGLVVKKNANLFFIGETACLARKNLKDNGIFVGDKVEYDEKQNMIERVLPRKNLLVRPPIANLDKMFIVIASTPKPDFYLIDKLIVFCKLNDISPILVVNKIDILSGKLKREIIKAYSDILPICFVSAKDDNTKQILKFVKGVCAFAGQSAVGKSSLINSILGEKKEEIGELSSKTDRGKQTTRLVTLYKLSKNDYLADTAGFSKLDENLIEVEKNLLDRYFDEFINYIPFCEYTSCNHIAEKKCAVKNAVNLGEIDEKRYNNYVKLFKVLKDKGSMYEKKS